MKHENIDKLDAFSKYKLNSLNPDEQPQVETQSIGHQHCCIMRNEINETFDAPSEYDLNSKSSEKQSIMVKQSIVKCPCPASKFSITSIDNLDPPTEYYLISKSSENQSIAEQPCHSPLEK